MNEGARERGSALFPRAAEGRETVAAHRLKTASERYEYENGERDSVEHGAAKLPQRRSVGT